VKEYSFEKLLVWKEARVLVNQIYQATHNFPASEKYGIVDQLRRASVSVTCNIAEGSGRKTVKDQKHFYRMAFSSALEVLNLCIIASDQEYLSSSGLRNIRNQIDKVTYMLNRLSRSL
jgi:four helix bundle protein